MLPEDISGLVSGRLTAIVRWPNRADNHWVCQCECGAITVVRAEHIKKEIVRSCGCLRRELSSERARRGVPHKNMDRHSKLPEYTTWCGMKARCTNKNNHAYRHYGGRGITVCERWLDFKNFYADMGPKPVGYSLDRIDNSHGYEPGNCRWTDKVTQQNNTRSTRHLTYGGETLSMMQWARKLGLAHQVISSRVYAGLPIERVLEPGKMRDISGLAKGGLANGIRQRSRTHCKHGHEFNEANTRWYLGNRACLICHRLREAKRREARRTA